MTKQEALTKLNAVVSTEKSQWFEEAEYRENNYEDIKKAQKIALIVLRTIRERNMSQLDLANEMGVSAQLVNKWLKGKENFTLSTIDKLETALDIELVQVAKPKPVLETMTKQFLLNEIWVLTFAGGFQRSGIYEGVVASENVRKQFREAVQVFITNLILQYKHKVEEEQHVKNIEAICKFSRDTSIEGLKIELNFGIAQKLLNLNLKYQWCLGWVKSPPHFPVDRIIQEKLNKEARNLKIPTITVEAWTKFTKPEEYLNVINFAKKIKQTNPEYCKLDLPELELLLFDRK
jgi:transcriptional regulator with XRE-family HTH domain